MVLFIYRPEYYDITEDEEGNPTQGMGELIVAKHRNGALDTVKLRFIGRLAKFQDPDGNEFGDFGTAGGAPLQPNTDFNSGTITRSSRMDDIEDDDGHDMPF